MLIVGQKIIFNQIYRINAKSYPFTPAFPGVRFKVVRERAVHGSQEGHRDRNRPGNLHQKEKALHRNVWCFFVLPAVYLNDPFREKCVWSTPQSATNAKYK